jgi:hypothetical protein
MKKTVLISRVTTPVFQGWDNGNVVYVYQLAVSYRRNATSLWGDSFWIVPGTAQ